MGLVLGKSFDRKYVVRMPFISGFYNISVFFSKRSSFVLFSIDPDFTKDIDHKHGVKINMFKNIESSRFVEIFLNLHNFSKSTLDIINQFEAIKAEYTNDISFIINETITLAKVETNDGRTFYDTLTLYGFTLVNYPNDFVFILAERQNIIRKLGRKVVRTTGLQISTSPALTLLNDYYGESKTSGIIQPMATSDEIIKFE
jgi:hypothetical protein